PFYFQTLSIIEEILAGDYKYLADFNIQSTIQIAQWLGMNRVFDQYTDYNFWFDEKPGIGDWGREVAKSLKASHYINSPGGESFIFPEAFESNKIKLGFLQPKLTPYNQQNKQFVPGLSIIDVLLFNGKEHTFEMIKNYQIKWKN